MKNVKTLFEDLPAEATKIKHDFEVLRVNVINACDKCIIKAKKRCGFWTLEIALMRMEPFNRFLWFSALAGGRNAALSLTGPSGKGHIPIALVSRGIVPDEHIHQDKSHHPTS